MDIPAAGANQVLKDRSLLMTSHILAAKPVETPVELILSFDVLGSPPPHATSGTLLELYRDLRQTLPEQVRALSANQSRR